MSEKSDEADRAWDDDPKEEPAAQSGEGEVHRVDTVPPPASGDAYSADTVIRDVPREALDAIRERRKNSEKRRAAGSPASANTESAPPKSKTDPPQESAEKPAAEKAPAAQAATKPAAPVAHPPSSALAPPVTSGELMIAFAAAIALIVIAFYLIGSAF